MVSNHSGGISTPDVLVFAPAFYDKFGYDRPVYTLAHYGVFIGPLSGWLHRIGVIEASRENAAAALHSGAAVLFFPGGDYDVYRPTSSANTIDFNGRKGYVRTAIETGVPIVPIVSISGQETQLFLTRGNWLARKIGLTKARLDILPVSFGLPFGRSVIFPPNLPLPAKIVTEVLEPIDITACFGDDPDIDGVVAHVRAVMQTALKRLAGSAPAAHPGLRNAPTPRPRHHAQTVTEQPYSSPRSRMEGAFRTNRRQAQAEFPSAAGIPA